MPQRPEPWSRHERDRWLRHDAHRFIRHDFRRFLAPGTDPADVYPALARRREREDAAFAAEIAKGYRLLAVLRAEVASMQADLLLRRLEETKYSPTQPRVPAGNRDGGQWTDRSGGGGTVGGLGQDAGQSQDADLTLPMGNVDIGDVSGSSELGDLFQIKPDSTRVGGVQLAGNLPDDPNKTPLDDPAPKVPQERPDTREGRMGFVRDAAQWVARNAVRYAPAVDAFFESLDQVGKINALTDAIRSANDPARTLEELQARVSPESEPGYQDHHIVGQHAENRQRFGDSLIDSRENLVRIPVLKHIDISAWYSKGNQDFGGLSPRDYLRDKDWDEQMRVGLNRLRNNKVLK
jgi:hypothetical protein